MGFSPAYRPCVAHAGRQKPALWTSKTTFMFFWYDVFGPSLEAHHPIPPAASSERRPAHQSEEER